MNNIDLETLEAYLDGKLASEEKILLENSLKEDASLREELELLKLSREAIAMNSWAELISGTQKPLHFGLGLEESPQVCLFYWWWQLWYYSSQRPKIPW